MHIVNACKKIGDSNGWEDHGIGDVLGGISATTMLTNTQSGWGVAAKPGSYTANCNNHFGSSSDLVVDVKNALQPDTRYGQGMESAAVEVYNGNSSDTKKVFSVQLSPDANDTVPFFGAYVGPTNTAPPSDSGNNGGGDTYGSGEPLKNNSSGPNAYDLVNLLNPFADYFYNVTGNCSPSNQPMCPDYSILNEYSDSIAPQDQIYNTGANGNGAPTGNHPTNGVDRFNFYFRPDCSYNPNTDVYLKWQRGQGTTQTQPDQSTHWILYDTSTGQPVSPPIYPYTQNYQSQDVGTLNKNHIYMWSWFDVNRAHGLSIWMPFSEVTSTSLFSPSSCGWNLTGHSSVSPAAGTQATFQHYINNSGPTNASYSWKIQGLYYSNGGTTQNGNYSEYHCGDNGTGEGTISQPAASNNVCPPTPLQNGSVPNGTYQGQPGNSPTHTLYYNFPSNAQAGDRYCQQIEYTPQSSTDGSSGNSSPVCVTYSPNGSANSTCFDTSLTVPGSLTGSYGGSDYGTYQARGVFYGAGYAYGTTQNPPNGLVSRNGGTPYTTSEGFAFAYGNSKAGTSTTDFTYSSASTGVRAVTEMQVNATFSYQVPTYDKYGNISGYQTVTYQQWTTVPGTHQDNQLPCYQAQCSISVQSEDPSGLVVAGGKYDVRIHVQDISPGGPANPWGWIPDPAYPSPAQYIPEPNIGAFIVEGINGNNSNYFEQSLDSPGTMWGGQTRDISFQVKAQTGGPHIENLTAYPGYTGQAGFQLGSGCQSVPVDVVQHFNLRGSPTGGLDDEENPTNFSYNTYVCNNEPGANASISLPGDVNTWLSGTPMAISGPPYNGSTYSPCDAPPIYSGNVPINPPVIAGENYCDNLSINYTQGYVNQAGQVFDTSTPFSQQGCDHVHNAPYFKVYGKGLSAGGEFSDISNTCSGGTLAGWNDNRNSLPDMGAGAELSNLALTNIVGFASSQNGVATGVDAARLNFANNGPAVNVGKPSPQLGGQYGSCQPLTKISPPLSALTYPASGVPLPNNINVNSVDAGMSGSQQSYVYGSSNSPTNATIDGGNPTGSVNAGHNISIFVNGNAYIKSNIVYKPGSWSPDANGAYQAPSFVLKATGNIYIDPSVTELDGLYVAEKDKAGNAGAIYTCQDANASIRILNLYEACNNQLKIYGALVADQINLMRSFGSLRDNKTYINEKPNEYGNNSLPICSNSGALASPVCAAEAIIFSPELYLSTPAVGLPNNGAVEYDAITSLPPVL